jgi:hypothetical protein
MNKDSENHIPFQNLEVFNEGKYHEVSLPINGSEINDPNVVVKVARTEWPEQFGSGWYALNDIEGVAEDLKLLKDASFSEFIPPTQLVLGENQEKEKVVYVLQDRIFGSNLDELPFSEEVSAQMKKFLDKSLNFFMNHLTNDPEYGPVSYFPDIKGIHFIFGVDKKREEANPRLYFVDTYPVFQVGVRELIDRYLPRHRELYFGPAWKNVLENFEAEVEQRLLEAKAI